LITKEFIHLHFPRTGGTSLRHVLSNKFRNDVTILSDMNHPAGTKIEQYNYDIPRFILTRNPWSWYVSWFGRRVRAHDFTGTFDEHLQQMLNGASYHSGFVPYSQVGTFSAAFDGFTFGGVDKIYRFEDVPIAYAEAVAHYSDIDFDDILYELEKCHLRADPAPRHYSTYYTDKTKDMVAEVDREYIKQFGYTFEKE